MKKRKRRIHKRRFCDDVIMYIISFFNCATQKMLYNDIKFPRKFLLYNVNISLRDLTKLNFVHTINYLNYNAFIWKDIFQLNIRTIEFLSLEDYTTSNYEFDNIKIACHPEWTKTNNIREFSIRCNKRLTLHHFYNDNYLNLKVQCHTLVLENCMKIPASYVCKTLHFVNFTGVYKFDKKNGVEETLIIENSSRDYLKPNPNIKTLKLVNCVIDNVNIVKLRNLYLTNSYPKIIPDVTESLMLKDMAPNKLSNSFMNRVLELDAKFVILEGKGDLEDLISLCVCNMNKLKELKYFVYNQSKCYKTICKKNVIIKKM